MISYIFKISLTTLVFFLFANYGYSNDDGQLLLIKFRSGESIQGEDYQIVQDTVPADRSKSNKSRRNKKDTSAIQANLGDSSYVGSAGTRSERSKTARKGRRRNQDTSIKANIGDSSYPGSGTRSRPSNDTINRNEKRP